MASESLGYEFKLTLEIKMLMLDILMIKILVKEEKDEEGNDCFIYKLRGVGGFFRFL